MSLTGERYRYSSPDKLVEQLKKRRRKTAKNLFSLDENSSLLSLSPSTFPILQVNSNMNECEILDLLSCEKRTDKETRLSSEHNIFQGNRCLIPLAHPPTGYRYNFPSFYSFVLPTHPLLYSGSTCSSSAAQPSSRKAANIPAFPSSSTGQENCSSPTQKLRGITQEKSKAA